MSDIKLFHIGAATVDELTGTTDTIEKSASVSPLQAVHAKGPIPGTSNGKPFLMVALKRTTVGYSVLRQQCLDMIRQWPGCETVAGIQLVRANSPSGFTLKITLYGTAETKNADKAAAFVERQILDRHGGCRPVQLPLPLRGAALNQKAAY